MSDFRENSQTMSLSDAIKTSANKMLFDTLLKNPEKRAQVLELLTQEGLVGSNENSSPNSGKAQRYYSPIKKLQKNNSLLNCSPKSKSKTENVRLESPSALGRRRALQRLESDSSVEEPPQKAPSPQFVGTPKPFECLLEGVVAFCEIRSNGEDRSSAIKSMMQSMGAKVKDTLCRGVTHVVLKDGLYTTYRKAKLLKIHVVSVLWLEAVRRHKFRVPESNFPAVCADAYEADITKICQEMQKDYDDVIQDELNKSTQSDTRRLSETPRKFITNRKKSVKSRSTVYGLDCTGFKEAHNRTEIAAPYKFKCNEPELSESDSYISVGSNSNHSMDIVPSSQDAAIPLPNYQCKNPELTNVPEEDVDDVPESNLAKYVKDSFELDKAAKIRSPESILKRSTQRQKTVTDNQRISLESEESLVLRVSTDESGLNNTGNKSKSHSSSKNLLEMSSKEKSTTEDEIQSLNLHLSESNTSKHSNSNDIVELPKNLDNISRPGSSLSLSSSDIDMNKNKTRRRTVGLKKPVKKDAQLNNITVNSNISSNIDTPKRNKSSNITDSTVSDLEINTSKVDTNKIKRNTRRNTIYTVDNIEEKENTKVTVNNSSNINTPKRNRSKNTTDSTVSDLEINTSKVDTKQNEIKRNTRRKTIYTVSNVEEKETRKTRRKTMANLSETNSTENSEHISDKTNPEEPQNEPVTTRKSRRKTIANVEPDKPVKIVNEEKKTEENNPSTSDSSTEKNKRRVRKLYNPQQTLSASQINWNDEPQEDKTETETKTNVSPPKKGKYQVPIKELPKILSSKAHKTKSAVKSTAKAVPTSTTDNKNKRKSIRALNFDSTSSEASDRETNPKPVQTPVRKSERITRTPAKNLNISSDSDLSEKTPKPARKPQTQTIRTQLLKNNLPKNSSSDESPKKRRSTLDFIPRQPRKTFEEIKQSQKIKTPFRLPSIVCTRMHKGDVQVFQQIVKKLGGFVVEDEVTKRTTHLIAGAPARTVNMLRAIARGCWILKHEWLFKSLEAGKWLQEEDYEMVEFSPTVQKCRLEKQSFDHLYSMDLFISCGPIFISRSSTPRFSDLEELVQLCGGRVVRFPRDAQVVVAEDAAHEGVVCVSEKWILDSIEQYKLKKFKGYLLQSGTSPVL